MFIGNSQLDEFLENQANSSSVLYDEDDEDEEDNEQ